MRQEITLSLIALVILITAIFLGKSSEIYNSQYSVKEKIGFTASGESVIWVYNGCGRPRVAERVTNILRDKGFDAYNKRNMPMQTYSNTLVISRTGDMKTAKSVAEHLNVKNPFFLISDVETTNEITVIVGDSFRELE
ncbi:MAG: LytR C-terminal domain-containing protein [Chitinispirillales bacterium]|jgi:hypothetical protein|nr:LytR C-terminal domain-containing protein [Chitinispirillales bacterium]